MNPKKKIERSELYRMVWEEALSKLAPKLGLSDVSLHKICKRHNVPLPTQGYSVNSLAILTLLGQVFASNSGSSAHSVQEPLVLRGRIVDRR